jgi:hypothetical protein
VLTFNRKFRPTDTAVLATTMNNVGAAHEKCGDLPEAVSYFRSAAEALERSSVANKEAKIAHVKNRLAQINAKMAGQPETAPPSAGSSQRPGANGDGQSALGVVQSPPRVDSPPPPPPSAKAPSPTLPASSAAAAPAPRNPAAAAQPPPPPHDRPVEIASAGVAAAAAAGADPAALPFDEDQEGEEPLSNDREVAE